MLAALAVLGGCANPSRITSAGDGTYYLTGPAGQGKVGLNQDRIDDAITFCGKTMQSAQLIERSATDVSSASYTNIVDSDGRPQAQISDAPAVLPGARFRCIQ